MFMPDIFAHFQILNLCSKKIAFFRQPELIVLALHMNISTRTIAILNQINI